MPEENKDQLKHQFTAVNVPIVLAEDGTSKRRTFDAEVYSGGRIDNHYFWGRSGVVIDLQNIQLKTKIGLVEEHFGGLRVGVATEFETTNKFRAKGHFLSNPRAQEIVSDADEEYPFQMSWWADPESIEEISAGKTITVNGQEFTGPLHVFRNVRVHEITICGVGADTQTSIQAFSSKTNSNPIEDTNVTELEQAKAAQKKAEEERDAAQNELKKFKADKRAEDITALETTLNKQFSAEEKKSYTDMDDLSFNFLSQQLKQFSAGTQLPTGQPNGNNIPNQFAHLFSHQANGGQGGASNSDQPHKFTSGAQAFADQKKGA
ncbi:hypothetical protein [Acinetobacter bereziniae]|uniref:hypothetical protein n=1 Tax=Acinetobacter bereziniae TaxID=106648 RepID=UPI000C2B7ECF|nr:hypothetical protein [Acinetobacter bereziniae]ATZ62942.1 hypothetical protein BSR55_06115 [Acinetobacter bereziniae]